MNVSPPEKIAKHRMRPTCDSDSALGRTRCASGGLTPATELNELFTLPLGVGDCTGPPSRSLDPLTDPDDVLDGAPSEVWIFRVAGGRLAFCCWLFLDLNKNAIVKVRS